MKEIWKDIEGYEGCYQVSNLGRVRSSDRYVKAGYGSESSVEGKILTPNIKKGYESVGLCIDGSRKWFLVHRLVAMAFILNPNNYPVVHHIDEVKDNNKVENLEWCSYQYNNTYGNRLKGWGHKVRKKLSKSVIQYTMDGVFVKKWHSMIDAQREDGFNQGCISNCCRGVANSHKGYIWKYEEDVINGR